jgi:hypothetical protein
MKNWHPLLDFITTLLVGLVPGAIGAAIALAWEKGISWSQRFLQLAVGTIVSFYVSRAIGAGHHLYSGALLDPFVMDGIKFTIGLIAFKATPGFVASAVDVIGGLPKALRDRFLTKGDT